MANLKTQREKLTEYFKTLTPNVYFQPPASVKMVYPAIVFNRAGWNPSFANDSVYLEFRGYEILVISKDPDEEMASTILKDLKYINLDREYVTENLYHVLLVLNI